MNGFYISVSNGLLSKDHKERMGSAIWEFMWCLDKVTKVDDKGIGWVLGGKPIKLDELGLGTSEDTVSRNLHKLQDEGYLKLIRTPYGLSIRVMKAKKRFYKNAVSNTSDDNVESLRKNAVSNKTVSVDRAEDIVAKRDEVFDFKEKLQTMKKSNDKRIVIIACYWFYKKFSFENEKQYQPALKRELRPAGSLSGYEIKDIVKSMEYCAKEYNVWTLETVYKRIDDTKKHPDDKKFVPGVGWV